MFTRLFAGAFWLMLGCTVAQAADLPDGYPRAYDLGGTLEAVDTGKLMLTVSDLQVRVSSATRVHTPQGGNSYLGSLRKGQTVGVQFIDPGSSSPTASDIWVLPGAQHLLPPPPGR